MKRKLTPNERKQLIIVLASCILILAVVFISTFYDAKKTGASLIAHEGFTTGTIINLQHGRGTDFMNIYVQYNFSIKGKPQSYTQYANWNITWDSLIGKTFPVIYDTTNPFQFYILIFPDDFKYNNLSFPDSLKWVLKFNKK